MPKYIHRYTLDDQLIRLQRLASVCRKTVKVLEICDAHESFIIRHTALELISEDGLISEHLVCPTFNLIVISFSQSQWHENRFTVYTS